MRDTFYALANLLLIVVHTTFLQSYLLYLLYLLSAVQGRRFRQEFPRGGLRPLGDGCAAAHTWPMRATLALVVEARGACIRLGRQSAHRAPARRRLVRRLLTSLSQRVCVHVLCESV